MDLPILQQKGSNKRARKISKNILGEEEQKVCSHLFLDNTLIFNF